MSRIHSSLAGSLVFLLLICTTAQGAGLPYRVFVIDDDPAVNVIPWGINNDGTVVGWYIEWPDSKAFQWNRQDGLTLLPLPPGETRYMAREISDSGIIAGGYEFGTAWTYSEGAFNLIGTLPGHLSSEAWGVNDQGDAAGTADPSDILDFTAFFYDAAADSMIQIGDAFSRAWDVNNAQQVTGHVGPEAYRWSPSGGMEFLGPLDPTFSSTYGFAINEDGSIVGEALDPTNLNSSRAFVFTDKAGMTMIPPVAFGLNRAWGINNLGEVVGESQHTGFGDQGWLWTAERGTQQLRNMVDPSENIAIIAAYDINDNGQIVALAFDNNIGEFVAVMLAPNQPHRRVPNAL